MKYEIKLTTRFKKDLKVLKKRGKDLQVLGEVIDTLANGELLPLKNQDHSLNGEMNGYRECHIYPDWLLIYKIEASILALVLVRTGSHSDLFT